MEMELEILLIFIIKQKMLIFESNSILSYRLFCAEKSFRLYVYDSMVPVRLKVWTKHIINRLSHF